LRPCLPQFGDHTVRRTMGQMLGSLTDGQEKAHNAATNIPRQHSRAHWPDAAFAGATGTGLEQSSRMHRNPACSSLKPAARWYRLFTSQQATLLARVAHRPCAARTA